MSISIHVQGLAELQTLWGQAPEIVSEELMSAVLQAEMLLEREIKELTPVGVGGAGGLRGSIAAQEPKVLANQVLGVVGTSAMHAVPVELGTKPHFPPIEPLIDWVRQKLDVREEDVRGVAFAVARKIAARGTLPVGMFHRAFATNRPQVEAFYETANVRIVERLGGAS